MNTNFILFNSRDELLRVNPSKVVYFEADGNYTNIILANKTKSTVCMNLSKLQELLSKLLGDQASHFARVGKSHIVNLNYVYAIQSLKQRLVLSDQDTFALQIPVSKGSLKQLKDIFLQSYTATAK